VYKVSFASNHFPILPITSPSFHQRPYNGSPQNPSKLTTRSTTTTKMSNQAWQIASPGTLVLNSTGPPPTPAPNEVLVRMHAMSLNYRDILVTDHSPSYPLPSKPNLIPGSDGAGVIELAGSQSHWKAGDRVILHPNTWLSGSPRNYVFEQTLGGAERDGTLQRFMCVDESYVVNAPGGMSLVEASTLFTAGVTAWNALCYGNEEGNGVGFLEGRTVLTQGTGGVSCYAIQVSFLPITSISETV
jgi:NADPH:quinone reductase-like Zn-dependent oxidoreductase